MFSQILEPTQATSCFSLIWPVNQEHWEAQSPVFLAVYWVCIGSVRGFNCKIRCKCLRPKRQLSSSFLNKENILLTPTKPNTNTLTSFHSLSFSVGAGFQWLIQEDKWSIYEMSYANRCCICFYNMKLKKKIMCLRQLYINQLFWHETLFPVFKYPALEDITKHCRVSLSDIYLEKLLPS